MKRVLLVTEGIFHPPFLARRVLRDVLKSLDGITFSHVRSMEKLPADLDSFDAIVIFVHHKRISDSAEEKLGRFVSSGGGVMGIHSATASFKDAGQYFEILGGRFVGHGPVESFKVTPEKRKDTFGGIPAFEVFDELYLHDFEIEVEVHFTARHEGKDVPAVWTSSFGKGRVFYAVPGHTTGTMKNKTYQKLLQQGLLWVVDK